MPTKEQQEKQAKRYGPIGEHDRHAIYKTVRDTLGDGELGLTVSIQLQEYGRLRGLERKYLDTIRKSPSQVLREVADGLEND